jgi:hypothetical protein
MVAGKLSLWFDENEIEELAEERFKRVEAFGTLLGAGYRPDDISDYLRLRLPPHSDNGGRIPFNLQPVSDTTVQGREDHAKRSTRSSASSDRVDELLAGLDATLSRIGRESVADSRETPEVPARWKGLRAVLDRFVAEREKAAARKWSRFYGEQRARVLDRFDELAGSTTERERRDKPVDELAMGEDKLLETIFPKGDEDMLLKARIVPLITSHLQDGHAFVGAHDAPGAAPAGFSVEDPRVMEAIERRAIQASKVNDTTTGDLREIIRTGFAEGDTTAQLGERLAEYFKASVGEDKARPMTAAATQTTGIVNDGRMIAARSVGGLLKGWLHGGSREPRPAHLAAESQYQAEPIGLEEKFSVNGFAADAPGDAALPAGETCNCTCSVTFHRAGKQGGN